jgi:VanZ family protein
MGALCICTMVIILVAGLWPFHAAKNDVTWFAKENGLRFGDHGTILSRSAFEAHGSKNNSSGSLEIWLERARSKRKNTILAFEGSGHTEAPFLLQQNGDALIVQRRNTDDEGNCRIAEFVIEGALPEKKRLFVTITLGPHKSSVYLDGVLVGTSEILGRTPGTLTGRLVLGNSLTTSDSWSGQISGLAIYEHELTAARVFEHYEEWTKNHRPMLTQDEQPTALYLFNEREGNVVHNQLGPSTDLIIPVRYLVLQSAFLSLPWQGYHPTWSYWEDVGLNIIGFIPLGFFFVAYFSTVHATRNAAAATILLGFLTSLTIELLQAYLPTRDSGMNDLVTNTLGTALGVLLYHSFMVQKLLGELFAKQLVAQSTREHGSEKRDFELTNL